MTLGEVFESFQATRRLSVTRMFRSIRPSTRSRSSPSPAARPPAFARGATLFATESIHDTVGVQDHRSELTFAEIRSLFDRPVVQQPPTWLPLHSAGGVGGNYMSIAVAPTSAPTNASDEQLLGVIAAGDAAAFALFYERHRHVALTIAYRVLDDYHAAEDAVQIAFLSVWRFAPAFQKERGSVRAWFLTIVRHAAVDRRRGRLGRAHQHAPLDAVAHLASDGQETFALAAALVEAGRLRAALGELPAKQREALEFAYFGGLSCQEIARRTATPLGTIKGRIRLGLRKLRTELGDLAPSATAQELAAS